MTRRKIYLNKINIKEHELKIAVTNNGTRYHIEKMSYINLTKSNSLIELDVIQANATEDFKSFKLVDLVSVNENSNDIEPEIIKELLKYFESNIEEFNKVNLSAKKFIDKKLTTKNHYKNYQKRKNGASFDYGFSREYRKNNKKDLYPVSIISKEYGLSALKMNELLHGLGLQYYVGKCWNVYSPLEQMSLTSLNYRNVGNKKVFQNVRWTSKGMLLIERLLRSKGIHKMRYVEDKKEHFLKISQLSKPKDEKVKSLTRNQLLNI